jgi:hypothetical protein
VNRFDKYAVPIVQTVVGVAVVWALFILPLFAIKPGCW